MQINGLKLDERDIKILAILQREGRITKATLSQRVNLSPSPCWERLKRLEQAGIIEGYSARLSPALFDNLTFFFMQAELVSHQAQVFEHFERTVQELDQVHECWAVGGGFDYILKIAALDVDSYQRFVDRLLDAEIGLKRYYTYVVTKRVKDSGSLQLPIAGEDGP